MNPLSSLNSAASRTAQASQALSARSNAADAQATLANRLAEKLGVPPGSLSGSRDEYTPEKVAGRILGFIADSTVIWPPIP
nr:MULTISPECIES: hypothetical protein [unclassified Pseudomonas]